MRANGYISERSRSRNCLLAINEHEAEMFAYVSGDIEDTIPSTYTSSAFHDPTIRHEPALNKEPTFTMLFSLLDYEMSPETPHTSTCLYGPNMERESTCEI